MIKDLNVIWNFAIYGNFQFHYILEVSYLIYFISTILVE